MPTDQVKALVFDVFGTVVDYRSTIIEEGQQLSQQKNLPPVNWGRFSDEWRGQYVPNMQRVMRGELPWTYLDALHRMALDQLLTRFGLEDHFNETEKIHLNKVWHRLKPWPDAVEGLTRLRRKFIIATLSNGNVALLVNMAKHSNLPWDCILSAELVEAYKPDPRPYQMAYKLLDLQPHEVMLVAAHQNDLQAAQSQGLQAAFILRPHEYGPDKTPDLTPDPAFQLVASDFLDLAAKLGC